MSHPTTPIPRFNTCLDPQSTPDLQASLLRHEPHPSGSRRMFLLGWKVSLTILHLVGIGSTLFRFHYRYSTGRLWWDDYSSLLPLLMECAYLVILWLLKVPDGSQIQREVTIFWITFVSLSVLLWTSRVCLALSIARIFPVAHTTRRFSLCMAILFALTGLTFLLDRIVACARVGSRRNPNPGTTVCGGKHIYGTALFFCDMLADLLLIACPLHALWRIKLPKLERRLILTVFSASALTWLVSVVWFSIGHTSFGRSPIGLILMLVTPHLLAGTSVIASNLAVVVTYFYRSFRPTGDLEMDPTAESKWNSTGVTTRHLPSPIVLTEISDSLAPSSDTARTAVL